MRYRTDNERSIELNYRPQYGAYIVASFLCFAGGYFLFQSLQVVHPFCAAHNKRMAVVGDLNLFYIDPRKLYHHLISWIHGVVISSYSLLYLRRKIDLALYQKALAITCGYLVATTFLGYLQPEVADMNFAWNMQHWDKKFMVLHHILLFLGITLYEQQGAYILASGLFIELTVIPLYYTWVFYKLQYGIYYPRAFALSGCIVLLCYAWRVYRLMVVCYKLARKQLWHGFSFLPILLANAYWFSLLVSRSVELL